MIMERLRTAAEYPGNKGETQQSAIRQARELLNSAGVVDPEMSIATSIETVSSIPEGAIRLPNLTIGGKNNGEIESLLNSARGLNLGDWGRNIIRIMSTSKEERTIKLMAIDSRAMGLPEDSTTRQIWEKALSLGDKVPAETAAYIILEAAKERMPVEIGKPLIMIMDTIPDSRGNPYVLYVGRSKERLLLDARYAYPGREWNPVCRFVVSPRK